MFFCKMPLFDGTGTQSTFSTGAFVNHTFHLSQTRRMTQPEPLFQLF